MADCELWEGPREGSLRHYLLDQFSATYRFLIRVNQTIKTVYCTGDTYIHDPLIHEKTVVKALLGPSGLSVRSCCSGLPRLSKQGRPTRRVRGPGAVAAHAAVAHAHSSGAWWRRRRRAEAVHAHPAARALWAALALHSAAVPCVGDPAGRRRAGRARGAHHLRLRRLWQRRRPRGGLSHAYAHRRAPVEAWAQRLLVHTAGCFARHLRARAVRGATRRRVDVAHLRHQAPGGAGEVRGVEGPVAAALSGGIRGAAVLSCRPRQSACWATGA